ncbi:MAG: hypothetical protein ACRDR6_01065 [Pseudonocardiaceae bacterium]
MRVSAVFAMVGHDQGGDYPFCGCHGGYVGYQGSYDGGGDFYPQYYQYYNGYNYGGYTYYGHDRRLGKL